MVHGSDIRSRPEETRIKGVVAKRKKHGVCINCELSLQDIIGMELESNAIGMHYCTQVATGISLSLLSNHIPASPGSLGVGCVVY